MVGAVPPSPPPQKPEDKEAMEDVKTMMALEMFQGPIMTFKGSGMQEAMNEDDPDYKPPPLELQG